MVDINLGVPKVGQSAFNDAVKALDGTQVVAKIGEMDDVDMAVTELAGRILRHAGLIQNRPDPVRQARRNAFLTELRKALDGASEVALAGFDGAVNTIHHAEDGHHRILAAREKCDFLALDLPARIGALIARARHELHDLHRSIERSIADSGSLTLGDSLSIPRDEAEPISPEAVHSQLVRSLGAALKLEGYGAGLFDVDGRLVVPEPVVPDQAALIAIGSELVLGTLWLQWEHFHKTARYLGDEISVEQAEIPVGDGGDGATQGPLRKVTLFQRSRNANQVDFIANERSLRREGLSGGKMVFTTNVLDGASGIDGMVPLWPEAWVSAEEAGHAAALSEALGYNVATDQHRPGGLRLVEWLRCYSSLSALASSREGEDGFLPSTMEEISEFLSRMSIGAKQIGKFLKAASFGRSSRDLQDAPLIATPSGFLLAGPGLADQRLVRIIPSMLASRGVQLKRKGAAFEERVLEFLSKQRMDARTVKHDDKNVGELQYDVLARWQDHILLIECKNRGLSDNDPATAYHKISQTADDIEQVKRLKKGLADNSSILEKHFGKDAPILPIIPIVLHNETWQLAGALDGVYVHDWSALTRFFQEPAYHITRLHRVNGQTIANRVPIASLWEGDLPTPFDLIKQLEEPIQTRIEEAHARLAGHQFPLDEETIVQNWWQRLDPKTETSMCNVFGVDVTAVQTTLDRQGAAIDAMAEGEYPPR
ncbi:nuclease-related domain-containing protein [Parasphingorhabdus sp. NYA22]